MSSSILSSQSMAMALIALSGTVIVVLSFCLHKSHPSTSSEMKKKEMKKKKKKGRKRVHFADDLAICSTEELSRKKGLILGSTPATGRAPPRRLRTSNSGGGGGGMPANRVALYNGILRDRLVHRIAYSL